MYLFLARFSLYTSSSFNLLHYNNAQKRKVPLFQHDHQLVERLDHGILVSGVDVVRV